MKISVVVGANGFLGSAIVHKLINENVEVWAVYNNKHENINQKAKKITSPELFELNIQPDNIFFVTGNYANSHQELILINDTLLKYTQHFKKAKIIFVSSTNVYENKKAIITEESAFGNPNIYAHSKIAGEFIVKGCESFAIARLTYIFGPRITNNSFIPQIIKSAKEKGIIQLCGDGSRKQDYLYIDDAVDFCFRIAMVDENKIFLGATGISTSNKEIAEEIKKNIDCKIIYNGTELGQSYFFNPKITHELLNWQPKISISEGIKNMITR